MIMNTDMNMDEDEEVIIREEDLTDEQRRERREWGRRFLRTLDEGVKMALGETERPSDRLTFKQKLEMWKRMADETDE